MRVASFNVGCRDLSYFLDKVATDGVLSSADVIFLQEIEEYHATAEIEKTLSHFGYYNFSPSRSLKKGEHGIAILSKFPILDHAIVELPFFRLFFRSRKRIAVTASVLVGNKKVQICNVHLDSRLNIDDRIAQLAPLLDQLKSTCDLNILAGDFNTIPLKLYKNFFPVGPANQTFQMMEFLKSHGFRTMEKQPKFSMRGRGVKWLLDFIYVSGLEMENYGVSENIMTSDHHPVWADIRI